MGTWKIKQRMEGDGRKVKTEELQSIKDKCNVDANTQLMNKSYQHTKGKEVAIQIKVKAHCAASLSLGPTFCLPGVRSKNAQDL